MPSFQQLIQETTGITKEGERDIELKIRIRTFGKLDQSWKVAQRMWRHLRVTSGGCFDFELLNGEKITDDYSDDDDESWHSLNWGSDPELRGKAVDRSQLNATGDKATT